MDKTKVEFVERQKLEITKAISFLCVMYFAGFAFTAGAISCAALWNVTAAVAFSNASWKDEKVNGGGE